MDNYSRSQKINDYAADHHGGDTSPAATVADATIAQTYAILALVDELREHHPKTIVINNPFAEHNDMAYPDGLDHEGNEVDEDGN